MKKMNLNNLFARSGMTFAAMLAVMPSAVDALPLFPQPVQAVEAAVSDYPRETLSSRLQRIKQHYGIGLTYDQGKASGVMVPAAKQVSADEDIAQSVNASGLFAYSKQGKLYTVYPKAGDAVAATPADQQQKRKSGTLSGSVVAQDGSPITGAIIRIEGTNKGTASDINGKFTISNVPAKGFSVEVSCLGYTTMRVDNVIVARGKTQPLNVILKEATESLKEVVVTANYNNANANALYARQKNMVAMSDGISADLMKKTSDNNMAQVLRRVSGVTIEGGKFINVRGMGERYNNVELNGTTLPSTEPNRRNFAFDLIPSNLVDNVTIAKTFTPDMQGEFTGGLVNVSTLSIPRERIIQLSMGTGFNSISTGKDFYGGQRLDGDYFLGNNKDRDWFNRDWVNDTYATFIDGGGNIKEADKQKAYDMNARIPNYWGLRRFTGKPTQNYAFTFGQPFTLRNGDKLGVIVSGTYRHEENAQDMAPSKFRKYEEFMKQGNGYKFATAVGAIANIGYEHGGHKITWSNMFNNRFTQNNTQRVVFNNSANTNALEQYSSPLRNVLWQTRLEGEHRFLQDTWILKWFADYNKMTRGQHDDRVMPGGIANYTENMPYSDMMVSWGPTPGQTAFDLGEGHIMYNDLAETKKNIGFNLSRSFVVEGNKQVVKAGYWGTFRKSDYKQQYLKPLLPSMGSDRTWMRGLNIEEVFAPENFKGGKLIYKQGGQWGPIMDYYHGKQTVHAAYLMGEFTFLKKLHLTTGVRMEKSKMTVKSFFPDSKTALPKDSTVTNDKTDFLPAATLIYNLTDNINLRAAYGKTLARPEFRELTRFKYYNVADRMDMAGFPLENTYINNYDVRIEWYPEVGEVISLGFFYKKFKKPIELITSMLSAGNYTGLIFNLDDASTKGIEFNLRKSFGFLAPATFLKDLYLNANVTWLSGDVNYNFNRLIDEANGLGTPDKDAYKDSNRKRPLLGMAPFIVNAGLSYSGKWFGAALNYGTTGRRIVTAGEDEAGDEYEKSRSLLDAQISVKPLKNLEVKFNASDLLNQATIVYLNRPSNITDKDAVAVAKDKGYQEGVDIVRSQYKTGTSYSVSVSYTF